MATVANPANPKGAPKTRKGKAWRALVKKHGVIEAARRWPSVKRQRSYAKSGGKKKNPSNPWPKGKGLSTAHRAKISRSLKRAWRTSPGSWLRGKRRTRSNPLASVGNPAPPPGRHLLGTGIGYFGSLVLGSTFTERVVPMLPQLVKVGIRTLAGVGLSFLVERLEIADADAVMEGALLYGLSEATRSLVRGRALPVIRTGLENIAPALPAPAAGATSGFVPAEKPRMLGRRAAGIVPATTAPLTVETSTARTRSRFAG